MTTSDPLRFPSRSSGPLAITHTTVVPMDTERLLENQTVVVDDGVIRTVDASNSVDVSSMQVIDGSGMYLMPGLADMHVHYWDVGEFGMFLANGVTLVRNMWGAPFHLALQQKVSEGVFPGPRVVTTSPIIDGAGPSGRTIWPGSTLLDRPEDARPIVQRYAARGYQQIKAYSLLTLSNLRALGAAARDAGLRMTGHCPNTITYEDAIGAGMSCFEHLTGLAYGRLREGHELPSGRNTALDAMRLTARYLDLDSVRRLAHQMADQQMWNCPTTVVWQGMSQRESVAMANPWLKYEHPLAVGSWNPANDFRFRNAPYSRDEFMEASEARNEMLLQAVSVLYQEGAPLLLGTDTPNPFVFQGFSIHQELQNLVRAGLSSFEALRCGTSEAARFLDQSDAWGTVAPGKRADLLLVRGNPLRDVAALRDLEAVLVNGYYLSRPELDAMLERRAASVQAPRVPQAVSLSATDGEGEVVAQGEWMERIAGVEVGRIGYRHRRSPHGNWLIEEQHARHESGTTERTAVELELRQDFTIDLCRVRTESLLGAVRREVRRASDGAYTYYIKEIDGHEAQGDIGQEAVFPSEPVAATALPLLLRAHSGLSEPSTLLTFGTGDGKVQVVSMELSDRSDSGTESRWEVRIDQPGRSTSQTYRLGPEGDVRGIEEMTWMGLRELKPVRPA